MKLLTLFAAALALAGCSAKDGAAGNTAAATPAAPVAGKPAPAGQSWSDTVVDTGQGYRMGNPDAAIKLVEYGSRLCPTCGRFAREGYEPLTANYVNTGKVSFEFREYLVHGVIDLPPDLLGLCGGAGPFFPILEQMFKDQEGFVTKSQAMPADKQQQMQGMAPPQVMVMLAEQMGLIDWIKQRGIPEAKARQCLTDMPTIDKLTKVTQEKTASGEVTGTPTFFINGRPYSGEPTWAGMEQALKALGA